jgi:hypothetical protein
VVSSVNSGVFGKQIDTFALLMLAAQLFKWRIPLKVGLKNKVVINRADKMVKATLLGTVFLIL